MVACSLGFLSVVALLSRCPFLDVNQQDKEGNTALMLAAQAGGAADPTLSASPCLQTDWATAPLPPQTLQRWVEGAWGLHRPFLGSQICLRALQATHLW